jgi:hypothetical protein
MLQFSHSLRPLLSPTSSTPGWSSLIVAADGGKLRPFVLKSVSHARPPERLAAELFGLRLARRIGLPVPSCEPIVVPAAGMGRSATGAAAQDELHLAIEYLGGSEGAVLELAPEFLIRRVMDKPYRLRLAMFIAWLDARPAPHQLYFRGEPWVGATTAAMHRGGRYRLGFVGFSGCLGGGSWKLRPLDPELALLEGADGDKGCDEAGPGLTFYGLEAELIARELQLVPREWLRNIPAATLTALPHSLQERARRVQVAQPAARHQPH